MGGRLTASPHRKPALTNTKANDIQTVQDMRSWVGLFKTLTPRISNLPHPFEEKNGTGRDSKEAFQWTFELEKQFHEAKEIIAKLVSLSLSSLS